MASSSGALPLTRRARPGPWPPAPPPQPQAQPLSWAKRTGFQARVSGESTSTASAPNSGQAPLPRPAEAPADLESGPPARPNSAVPPPPAAATTNAKPHPPPNQRQPQPPPAPPPRARRRDSDGGRPNGQPSAAPLPQLQEEGEEEDAPQRAAHVKYELRDTPGILPVAVFGFQHYISMLGSIILVPLVMVPAMGGSADDTAAVVSTVLLVSGITTLLHTLFGTRLPLVQGPSFVYLAPALAIINSPEFFGLNDNVGSYHASSLFVATRPPTAGIVSRGIGVEGVSTVLAGLWGTGVGSATITENVHTIAVTKMGSRKAVGFGAIVLIVLSIVGKVGAFIASIPDVMVAALLCFMWAMLCALGLSNLRYGATGSSRNCIVVGLALFLSLSIPSYFQQYGLHPNANSSVPTYFQPYNVASHGPIHTGFGGVNYVLNTLLSLNMVIAFLVAVVLDNTVPGGRHERGLYVWSEAEEATRESSFMEDYELPFKIGRAFKWAKCMGL
ncbi:hypothetical protein ACQ4PT_029914 [Festuca glaucescens]